MSQLSPRIAHFRESHITVARMFAAGMHIGEIKRRTGYSQRRLNLLWNDPAFQELIESFRGEVYADLDLFQEVGRSNMVRAELMLQDKIDDAELNGEPLPTREILAIVSDRADRFGYPKRSTQVNIDLGFSATLDRAIERSGKSKLIEGVVEKGSVAQAPASLNPPTPVLVHEPVRKTGATQPSAPPSFAKVLKRRF